MNDLQRPFLGTGMTTETAAVLAQEGEIVEAMGEEVVVRVEDVRLEARWAVFPFAPSEGDRVLVLSTPKPYVIGILEKAGFPTIASQGGRTVVDCPSEVEWRTRGPLLLTGNPVQLQCGDQSLVVDRQGISARACRLRTESDSLEMKAGNCRILGRRLGLMFQQVRVSCRRWENVVERWVDRLGDLFRWVTGAVQEKLDRVHTQVRGSVQATSGRLYLKAAKEVRIDGARIDLG